MTDDEILLLAEQSVNKVCVIAVTNDDLIAFAKAIADKEREECAKIVEKKMMMWGDNEVAMAIRARGE